MHSSKIKLLELKRSFWALGLALSLQQNTSIPKERMYNFVREKNYLKCHLMVLLLLSICTDTVVLRALPFPTYKQKMGCILVFYLLSSLELEKGPGSLWTTTAGCLLSSSS